MAKPFPPATMRAWQYSSTRGGLTSNLKINPTAPLPKPKPNQHLVQILAVALNPIDYKPAEVGLISMLAVPKPATPGIDFAGRIVTPAAGSPLKPGQLVFGVAGTSPLAGGALADFAIVEDRGMAAVPDGVEVLDAATVGVAGITAYQSIVPRVKKGDKVFINGGSGGTGIFGIQIAKAVGCHVTTSCSTPNVELCRSLGADVVLDYKKGSVLEALKASGFLYDHVVDNVGATKELYWRGHEYMKPEAVYVMVGGGPSLRGMSESLKRKVWPGPLGGMKREFSGFWPSQNTRDFEKLAAWMKEGKVCAVVDHMFAFGEAVAAIEKLKTGRARGKIVVDVALGMDGRS